MKPNPTPDPSADHEDAEMPPDSQHGKPPLALLAIWVVFFLYTFYYLFTYMVPDLKKWLHP